MPYAQCCGPRNVRGPDCNQIIGSVATYLFMIRSFAICLETAYELLVPRDLGQLLHYASITFLPNFGLRNKPRTFYREDDTLNGNRS